MTPPRLPARILVGPALRAQPDRRLVALAREGHEPAVEEVVRRYRPALVRYAATIVPAHRADDVVQDAIARALPAIRDGEAELHLRPWLYTIVRNTALNNLRDAGPAMDHLDESFDGVEQPPQALERREELAAVVAGVQSLPETQREALVKREMEGKSHAEIGAAMGVSVAAARQLIHRGRITLREGLGALIPMPVLRQLLEGLSAPAAAGTGAGGAIAAKALVALLAAGGAVTAGVALDRHSHQPAKADPIVAEREAAGPSGVGGVTGSAPGAGAGSGENRWAGGQGSSNGSDRSGSGQDSLTSLDSTGNSTRGGDGAGDGGPRSGSGHGGDSGLGDSEHHGGEDGGSGDGGEHSGDGSGHSGSSHESGDDGGSDGTSGEHGSGSGGDGGSESSGEPVSHEGSDNDSSGEGGSSGSGKTEPAAKTEPARPEDD